MFAKILIANRGEIACRVIRTARRMGIATVAVYSDADVAAQHVQMADEAYRVGAAPARESYLRIDAILEAAKHSGAQAIHPGYGFLSENAAFAEACAAAGLAFIGPPPEAIRAMGSKSAAKTLMERSGVPLVPGYHGEAQDDATLAAAAGRIGYPVLLKAWAGGGGKGMRIVERAEEFSASLASARREAKSSFDDDRMLVERYLRRPRHIEIQVFADAHGTVLNLFERDCSIQRRHQKVLEEAPAPGLSPQQRQAMGEAAVAAARAVGYIGAGTVEFIHEADRFYFMEMNTRLQVEHPVTEMITGQDLVEWQLRVAAGEPLWLAQEGLRITGHAIEARIYAEDPTRDFLPSIGRLVHLRQPTQDAQVRIDTGVREGDAITPDYDPMIAKLIVWDADRPSALRRLSAALAGWEVTGLRTNLALLRAIAGDPEFAAGAVDTGFIGRHPELLAPPSPVPSNLALAAAARRVLHDRERAAAAAAAATADPWSPWAGMDGWRLNGEVGQDLSFRAGETVVGVYTTPLADAGYRMVLPDGAHRVSGDGEQLRLDGRQVRCSVVVDGDRISVFAAGEVAELVLLDPLAPPTSEAADGGKVMAPIPGTVTRVLVQPGAQVTRGQALLVLEAMKMELTLSAPADGTVAELRCAVGEMVEEGRELILLQEEARPGLRPGPAGVSGPQTPLLK